MPPSGANWEQGGVLPNVEAAQGWDEFTVDEDDLALMTAASLLQETGAP